MKCFPKPLLFVFIMVGIVLFPSFIFAHPGRTDSSGCHTCRTNCSNWGLSTGEYHCHNAKALPQPKEPIRSHYGEGGTGTTEPWPEYKNQTQSVYLKSSTATPVTNSIIYSTLSKGMSGTEVTRLQQTLAKDPTVYPEGTVSGYFGPATELAVKRFQKKYGLSQIGIVGPMTRALLNTR